MLRPLDILKLITIGVGGYVYYWTNSSSSTNTTTPTSIRPYYLLRIFLKFKLLLPILTISTILPNQVVIVDVLLGEDPDLDVGEVVYHLLLWIIITNYYWIVLGDIWLLVVLVLALG